MSSVHVGIPALLQEDITRLSIPDALHKLTTDYPNAVTFSTSFSKEDQVITDLISKANAAISIFTLDTGRLFPETYSVWNETIQKYQKEIKAFYPDKKQLQLFVSKNGPNAFYDSVEKRLKCCHIRKVAPLRKALQHKAIWITGIRAEHSSERQQHPLLEWDETHQLIKYHPLLHWSSEEVEKYILLHHVPVNALYNKGFTSIGCAPCTRAIRPGEDLRAGRWWWENSSKKECGIHNSTIRQFDN